MALTAIRELITRLGFTMDDAEARRYEQRIRKLGQTIRGYGRTMSLFVTAPIVGLGIAFVKAAADAEETENKFHEVFKGLTGEADATAKALTKDFDLATVSAQEMLASTGDILVGFGFTRKAALDLSNQVNSLAVDIASFKNVQGGAARASNAITKALLGEREMLKGIGIAILEEDVKLKVLQLRQEGMTFATERQAKSFATLKLIIDRSKDSIGDYARTSESTTNQARKMRERFKELSVTFGKELLPLATELLKMLTGFLEWLNSFTPAGRKAIIIIAGIAAALGPLLIVLGSIVTILAAIPVLTLAAVAAVGALGYLIGEDIAAFMEGRKSVFGLIIEGVKKAFWFILDEAKKLIDRIKEYLGSIWDKWIKEHVQPWIDKITAAAALIGIGVKQPQAAALARYPAMEKLAFGQGTGFEAMRNAMDFERDLLRTGGALGRLERSEIPAVTINMEVTAAPGESAEATGRAAAHELHRTLGEAAARWATIPRMAP